MKLCFKLLVFFLFSSQVVFSQEKNDAAILKVILAKYYSKEKVIVKDRLQLLSFYCEKAQNNEEFFEIITKNEILKKNSAEIKKQISIKKAENWSNDLTTLFATENQYLKSKVNNCLSLEEFQKVSKRFNDNNQRLLIANKPIYFEKKYCLVKITLYRNIEHNYGCFLVLENINSKWEIKEILNEWAT